MRECLDIVLLRDSISENAETVAGSITDVQLDAVSILNTPVVMVNQRTTNILIEDGECVCGCVCVMCVCVGVCGV